MQTLGGKLDKEDQPMSSLESLEWETHEVST